MKETNNYKENIVMGDIDGKIRAQTEDELVESFGSVMKTETGNCLNSVVVKMVYNLLLRGFYTRKSQRMILELTLQVLVL